MAPSRAVSFPRLFRRLVESPKPAAASTNGTAYTEFRAILTGMLETYRSEGDMLVIAKHLVDRDIFDTVEELVKDTKHVTPLTEVDDEEQALREKARELVKRLRKVCDNLPLSQG